MSYIVSWQDTQSPSPHLSSNIEPQSDHSTPKAPNQNPPISPTPNPSSSDSFPDTADSDFADALALQTIPSPHNANVYSDFAPVSGDTLDAVSGAIVPFPSDTNTITAITVSRVQKRSGELVRVNNLTQEDHTYFRQVVRKTRMLYDSLRLFTVFDDEKKQGIGVGRKVRGDLRAASIMREHGLWLNRDKRIVGSIPGVFVGDLFLSRMELCVVGLHGQVQAGIDYLPSSESSNGEPIATSVIVSGGYEDDDDQGDVITYTGHGGRDKYNKPCAHQKMEAGNLALEKSMQYGIEVRVMRGIKCPGSVSHKVYLYDGLYRIVESWFDVGKSEFGVYQFKLVRIEDQPEMGTSKLRCAQDLKVKLLQVRPEGYLTLDLSVKKERLPVYLFNDIDLDHDPMCYKYLSEAIIPPFVNNFMGDSTGCGCIDGCKDDCVCAIKNGGEIPYDNYGYLLTGKPLIFECGPKCGCPPYCRNRMTQTGLKYRLEVFRSVETGWGVRTLDLINAGAFICEYAGIVLTCDQAQVCSMNGGDCLIHPGNFAPRWTEWGDLSQVNSEYVRPSKPSLPPLDFALDVSSYRNVACYMTHSICPNVMVQYVLNDHSNVMFPRTMLFAMENIPPMKELSIDYGVPDEYNAQLAICES